MMEQYKRILLKEFDSRQKVITELTNLEAILNLPKGTELYISDIHGEFAAFDYILRSCAGILNEKIKDCFGDSLSEDHKDRLSALVSYPELVLVEETKGQDWYQETIPQLLNCWLLQVRNTVAPRSGKPCRPSMPILSRSCSIVTGLWLIKSPILRIS